MDDNFKINEGVDISIQELRDWLDEKTKQGIKTVELDIDYFRGEIYEINLIAS